ncbi:O-antigen ligase family protein [Kaistella palustris]|uniref:O-antigen ligase family protein n=1 Tax=Kaistella palustris TaxID=493376 RepID=UPI0003FCA10D|nr:O-antigen ligase family protein [Kaistella palustris]
MEKIRLFVLYLYLFGLSIENWSPWGNQTSLLRPTLIFGMLYVIISLKDLRRNFRVGKIKNLLFPALWVFFWISFVSFFNASFKGYEYNFNYTLLSCILSFWLLSNDLSRYYFLRKHFLYIILINGIFISFLSYFQIGIDKGYMDRQSLLGNNSNIIGLTSSISLLIILYIIIENLEKINKKRYLLLFFIPFLLQTIAKTGSKGALISLSVSLITYFIILRKPIGQKIPLIILGIVGFIIGAFYMLQNEVLAERWRDFVETGDTTGRAERWELAFDVFLHNPIFGVGENGLATIAKAEFEDEGYDPHNVYLFVMATGGIIATVPFVIFLCRILQRGYNNKNIWKSNLHLILFLIMLIFWFKAGGGLNSKLAWAYFALISYTPYKSIKFKKL